MLRSPSRVKPIFLARAGAEIIHYALRLYLITKIIQFGKKISSATLNKIMFGSTILDLKRLGSATFYKAYSPKQFKHYN